MAIADAARAAAKKQKLSADVEARRQAAAAAGPGALGATPGVAPKTAPVTPQMRNSAGQMGPAVGGQKTTTAVQTPGGATGVQQSVRPPLGVNAVGQQPVVGPVVPGQPTPTPQPGLGQYTPEQIAEFAKGVGGVYQQDPDLINRQVAAEDTRLKGIRESQLKQLAASGQYSNAPALLAQTGAAAALDSANQVGNYRLGLDVEADRARREGITNALGITGSLLGQREKFGHETGERQSSQQFVAGESELERANQLGIARERNTAEMARLQTQIEAAKASQNDAQAFELETQLMNLKQKDKELGQQESQFARSLGLDEKKYETLKSQFDTTTDEGRRQFNEKLQFEVGQENTRRDEFNRNFGLDYDKLKQQASQFELGLLSDKELATLRSDTEKEIAALRAKTDSDIANINQPGGFELATGALAALASIPGIERLIPGIGNFLSGGGGGSTSNDLERLKDAAGGDDGGMTWTDSGLSTGGKLLVGGAGAVAVIDAYLKPGDNPLEGAAGGAAIGFAVGGPIGAVVGAGIGALAGAIGPGDRAVAKTAFTTAFDDTYRGLSGRGLLDLPPSDPKSAWSLQNRLAMAKEFAPLIAESAKMGVGKVEISEPDWQRMEGLGQAASVKGDDRHRFYAMDDPKLTAILGPGKPSDYVDIEYLGRNTDERMAETGGSLKNLIATGRVVIRDKQTGKEINMNDGAQLKEIASRHYPAEKPVPETDEERRARNAINEQNYRAREAQRQGGVGNTQVGGTRTDPVYTTPPKQPLGAS